jgi:glycosyltransferase involved in cell wall biosynthesis
LKQVFISTGFGEYGYLKLAEELSKLDNVNVYLYTGFLLKEGSISTKFFLWLKNHNIRPFSTMRIRIINKQIPLKIRSNNFLEIMFWFTKRFSSLQFYIIQFYVSQTKSILKSNKFDYLLFRAGYMSGLEINSGKTFSIIGIDNPERLQNILKILDERVSKNYNTIFWNNILKDVVKSHAVIVNNNHILKSFSTMVQSKESYLLCNPFDWNLLSKSHKLSKKNEKSILFVGEIGYRKGFDVYINIIKHLDFNDFSLTIIGPIEKNFKVHFNEFLNKYKNQITYKPGVSYEELINFYLSNEYFLFPTRSEGSSRAVQEAMFFGLITITTIESGVIVRNEENGFIIDNENLDFNRINEIFKISNLKKSLISLQAKSGIIENYSTDNYLNQLKKIINYK